MTAQIRSQMVDLLQRHGIRPRKALGQHFLADSNITRKIVGIAGVGPGDRVVEIGPGTGTLTAALAATGARVVAYEIDSALQPVLDEVLGGLPNVEVLIEDATRIDLNAALDGDGWVLVANLPYNVGTPLVLDVLRHVPAVSRMVVMVQREVAERFSAGPGGKDYGIPSVVIGIHGTAQLAFRVPAQVFIPAPAVESAVVVIDRLREPEDGERAIRLAVAAFGQRRKMLRRSLATLVEDPAALLTSAGFDPTSRAEELAPADYLRLAEVWDG